MENRTGYVVITTSEYKELLLKANKYDEENKNICVKEDENIFEKFFIKKMYENNSYDLKNMKELNNDDYHYKEMFMKFIKEGIKDFNYIHEQIKNMVEAYKKEGMEEDE